MCIYLQAVDVAGRSAEELSFRMGVENRKEEVQTAGVFCHDRTHGLR